MPASASLLLMTTTGLLAAGGIVEGLVHRRRLGRIPIRIHVNGTRGKSSVTRLIAAGLRAGGLRTCAKTTGALPRMILLDGSEYPVYRPARANVIEQLRIVEVAAGLGAEALVVECMALNPFLQWLSESRLIRATHGVITNAREDHLDVMGPSERDVAAALAATVPVRGTLFTAERRHLDLIRFAAADRGSKCIAVGPEDSEKIAPLDLAGFRYLEHADNIALALRVCTELGVDRGTALQGMWEARPDPGAMTSHEILFFGRRIFFVNGFAANDPQSTEQIWRQAINRYPETEKRIMLVNCRVDRPDRSRQLGEAVVRWPPADHYVLLGSGTFLFARTASRRGLNPLKLVFGESLRVDEVFETVVELAGKSVLVMGVANIGGLGLDVVRYFRNRSLVGAVE